MATTVTPADLVVTTAATLTLAGKTFDISASKTIASVKNADKRIIRVPTSQIDVVQVISAAVGKGTFDTFNFAAFINRDDTNYVRIRIRKGGADTVDFRLDAGQMMTFWNSKISVSATAAAFAAFQDYDSVAMQANTAAVDIEYLVAKV